MKNITYIFVFSIALSLISCADDKSPNYQFMPNMYEPEGYEAYSEGDIFQNSQSAKLPVEGSIPRGWAPYDYEDTPEGKALATAELKNPLPATEENLAKGKELYGYFCSVCHGDKGDGQGILAQREKFLGIPSYADPGRNITEGSIYHVQMYGLNAMGSYTAQTNEEERWQITMHVENLKAELEGRPLKYTFSDEAEAPEVENEEETVMEESAEDQTPSETIED